MRLYLIHDSLLLNSNAKTSVDKKILELITTARVGHLATAASNLQPYLTPVVFIALQNSILIPLDDKPKIIDVNRLRRVRNIEENPKVSFLVDHYDEDWTYLWFVMIIGNAKLIQLNRKTERKTKEMTKIRNMFLKKYSQYTKIGVGKTYIKLMIEKTIYWKYMDKH
jgi:coenzyme F420-0:L-glutamate ligase / coenzyme F420-1:gamma-L-glutamate ligase